MSQATENSASQGEDPAATAADEQTPEQRAEARRYSHIELACTLSDMAIDIVFLGLIAFVFARPIDAWLASFPALAGEQSMLRLVALFGVVMLLHIVVAVPLSFYSGYVVEHQFGLSKQSLRRWLRNWALSNTLA